MIDNLKKKSFDVGFMHDSCRKFRDAEQLWFWFLSCRQKDALLKRRGPLHRNPYPCEAIDVETLVTRLFLSGKLNPEQLEVLKEFGDKRRIPNQHIWAENKKAALWSAAMQTISVAAKEKRWME